MLRSPTIVDRKRPSRSCVIARPMRRRRATKDAPVCLAEERHKASTLGGMHRFLRPTRPGPSWPAEPRNGHAAPCTLPYRRRRATLAWAAAPGRSEEARSTGSRWRGRIHEPPCRGACAYGETTPAGARRRENLEKPCQGLGGCTGVDPALSILYAFVGNVEQPRLDDHRLCRLMKRRGVYRADRLGLSGRGRAATRPAAPSPLLPAPLSAAGAPTQDTWTHAHDGSGGDGRRPHGPQSPPAALHGLVASPVP
jgi:hypothetical protein